MESANPACLERTDEASADDFPARWLAEAERAAGLPAGSIARVLARQLVAGWLASGPGACSRWLDEHFDFEGEAEERASIAQALHRAEARLRAEAEAERSAGMGWH